MNEENEIKFKPKKRKQLRQRIKEESDDESVEEVRYVCFLSRSCRGKTGIFSENCYLMVT